MGKPGRTKDAGYTGLPELNRLIHEPARLLLMSLLYVLESADFVFLMDRTNLTQGNLSTHMSKLESAGYVEIRKEFVHRRPHTLYLLTTTGREAFLRYRDEIRQVLEQGDLG
ncbi:helix-turn-helix domain protein [bacterium BMS3Bbin04]|nr:helix-turn-helix domain protein [bacterium BMS3Bbin04]